MHKKTASQSHKSNYFNTSTLSAYLILRDLVKCHSKVSEKEQHISRHDCKEIRNTHFSRIKNWEYSSLSFFGCLYLLEEFKVLEPMYKKGVFWKDEFYKLFNEGESCSSQIPQNLLISDEAKPSQIWEGFEESSFASSDMRRFWQEKTIGSGHQKTFSYLMRQSRVRYEKVLRNLAPPHQIWEGFGRKNYRMTKTFRNNRNNVPIGTIGDPGTTGTKVDKFWWHAKKNSLSLKEGSNAALMW